MSSRSIPPDLEPTEEPVLELEALIPRDDPEFVESVSSSIDRRVLADDLITFSWSGLAAVLVQLAIATLGLLTSGKSDPEPEE